MEAQASEQKSPDRVRKDPARGQAPYSPSDPMDWEDNLDGLEHMYGGGGAGTPPPSSLKDKGVLVAGTKSPEGSGSDKSIEEEVSVREVKKGGETSGPGGIGGNGGGGEAVEREVQVSEKSIGQPIEAGRPKNGDPPPPPCFKLRGARRVAMGWAMRPPPAARRLLKRRDRLCWEIS
jgi:hypothetical protein